MRLFLDIGHYEQAGKRGVPNGSCIVAITDTGTDASHGVLLACAEGVAGRPEGQQAARSATTALGDTYYSATEGISAQEMLQEGVDAANHAVRATGERGRAATVAGLVLMGRRWYTAHAGHIRVWRYRDLQIKQLTRDHLVPRAPRQAEVTRACGFDQTLDAEHNEGEMHEGDIYVLTSAGVHDALSGAALLGVLQTDSTAQQMAELLVQQAMNLQSPAYAGACVARVEKLPRETTVSRGSLSLLPQLPESGTTIDGFAIEKLILKSRRFRLYKALDQESKTEVILRFPDPSYESNAQLFLREESISRRIDSPHILKPIQLRAGRRTVLYSAIEYRNTESIAKRIRRKQGLSLRETLKLADQLLATLETLHRQGVIHGDIRPHNLLHDRDKRQLYVFGLLASARQAAQDVDIPSGSLSYRAPELFNGSPATEKTDMYSAGVTIYRMLTGEYPYGKIGEDVKWNQLIYTSIAQYQEKVPSRLDDILARACAIDPADRYPGIAQFAAALSAVQIADPTPSSGPTVAKSQASSSDTSSKWAWGSAAALLAALLAYLYVTFR